MARPLLKIMFALALGALAGAAPAHGIYFAQRAGATTLVLGHGGDDLGYDPAKVTELRIADADGTLREARTELLRRQLSLAGGENPAWALASYAGGLHGKDRSGRWRAGGKIEQPPDARVGEYFKTAVAALSVQSDPARLAPPPRGLYLVPLAPPLALHAGRTLRVQVWFDGRPLAGARIVEDFVNHSHGAGARSDSRGMATLRIRNQGLNVLAVTHIEAREDEHAHFREHQATLSFHLPYADRH